MAEVHGLQRLLQAQYGIKTDYRENPDGQDVGTTTVRICGTNPNRVGLLIVNTGTTTIYVGPKNTVTSTNGIPLPAGGTSLSLRWDIDMELVIQNFYALSSAAGGKVYVLETYLTGIV